MKIDLTLGLCLSAALLISNIQPGQVSAAHKGEQRMLDVDIQFSGEKGTTVTSPLGIDYHFYGITMHENKVYPQKYWGSFPLYFFNERVGISVRVTNKGARNRAKIRIKTEAYVLRTNGSNGAALTSPRTIDVDLAKGETRTIDASFVAAYTPAADSGLNRFVVKVLHQNEGQGRGGEASLVMSKEGIFCPPEYAAKAKK